MEGNLLLKALACHQVHSVVAMTTENIRLSLAASHRQHWELHHGKNSVRGKAPLGFSVPEEAQSVSLSSITPVAVCITGSEKGAFILKQVLALYPAVEGPSWLFRVTHA